MAPKSANAANGTGGSRGIVLFTTAPMNGKVAATAPTNAKVKEQPSFHAPKTKNDQAGIIHNLFQIADLDGDGYIQFSEFLQYHKLVFAAAGNQFASSYDDIDEGATHVFRSQDANGDQQLDFEEFTTYMEALRDIVGQRSFQFLCAALAADQSLSKDKRDQGMVPHDGYDMKFSEVLLQHAQTVGYELPDNQATAIRFLESKADPNLQDNKGFHVLLHAALKSDAPFILTLLKYRANPNIHCTNMDCAAFLAARARQLPVLAALVLPIQASECTGTPNKRQELGRALMQGLSSKTDHPFSATDVRRLLTQRTDINFKDESGWTALTLGVLTNNLDCVDALIKAQSTLAGHLNFEQLNPWGRAPLHTAARKGLAEMANLLLHGRANPDVQDNVGWTPLHHAVFNNMPSCVKVLVEAGATLLIKGRYGLTAYLVAKLPSRVGDLPEKAMKLLEPPPDISFTKGVLPILKRAIPMWQKVQELMSLPGVHQQPACLRMHDMFFDPTHGPNKIRLQKVWEGLALQLIRRLRKDEVDLDPLPESCTEHEQDERTAEIQSRQKAQRDFVRQWLEDTRGLRPSPEWTHENRIGYGEKLREVVAEELVKFEEERDKIYNDAMKKEGGTELMALQLVEVLDKSMQSQLCAHPIPLWLETLDASAAFDALRQVGAGGICRDGTEVTGWITELLTIPFDFRTGQMFWRNVYRLWLCSYAKMVNADFQHRFNKLVDTFNANHREMGFNAVYTAAPVKTYDRIKFQALTLGRAANYHTYVARTADAQNMDLIRGLVVVNTPQAAMHLLDSYIRPLDLSENHLQLVRVSNFYHPDADVLDGFRKIELNLLYRGRLGHSVKAATVGLIGEVRIILEDFVPLIERRSLFVKILRGDFDWVQDPDYFGDESDIEETK